MSPDKYRAVLKWMIGLLVSVLAGGVVFAYLNRQTTGEALGAGSLLGWAVPLGVLFIIVAVSWFLLSQDHPDLSAETSYVVCPSCGQAVLREWRMCPYCGERAVRMEAVEEPAGVE